MVTTKNILPLTTELLARNAFNHLKDDEVSALHYQLLKLREPLTHKQQNLLLAFWNHAATGHLPASLCYRCNLVLHRFGRCMPDE